MADTFLLGVVILIIAIWLYRRCGKEKLEAPERLRVKTLRDLRESPLAMAIAILGICSYLGGVVAWIGEIHTLSFGAGIAALLVLIVAIFATIFVPVNQHRMSLEVSRQCCASHRNLPRTRHDIEMWQKER